VAEPSRPSRAERPGTPRWVIVLGLVALLLVVILVVMMVVGGGRHGPGRHTSGGTSGIEQVAGDPWRPAAGFSNHTPPGGAHP
jgi:hypothetical protein